jgi:putative endonuclease
MLLPFFVSQIFSLSLALGCASCYAARRMATGSFVRVVVRFLDQLASKLGVERTRRAEHLKTGQAGEDEAYFYLRRQGYVVIARNWRTLRRRGELDIVAWEGDTLCFVEVKTRSSRNIVPAEMSVDREKQRELRGMARVFLRRMPPETQFRFDVVSVYMVPGEEAEVSLFRDAFLWRSMKATGRRHWR